MKVTRAVRVLDDVDPCAIPFESLIAENRPTVLKGVAGDWPLTRAGIAGPRAATEYLARFYEGRPVTAYTGEPGAGPRFFYDDSATRMNFTSERVPLGEFLERIVGSDEGDQTPARYIGSTDCDLYLPGLRSENDLSLDHPVFEAVPPLVSIWIGGQTTAAAHFDMSNNIACCVAGRRRFTLFPPDQVENLYPGPLEPTPGGQVISMVDFDAPDLDRYPRFAEAVAAGEVAELEPGDAIFFPALWWHQVEALDGFNILINYWWNASPPFMDTPMNTLLHGLLSLRDRPEEEKRGWHALFNYYVFGDAGQAGAHLPEAARGPLAPLDAMNARRLRAQLLNRLNR
ncbi:cupin-like domain-containing protein [Stakelama marina]|uniref:cupin-like domain-containing protein n=1 Tax=Stakelama marina TaxID=2826939 RepID=UPI0024C2178C|nr:cupin-like domain-containing protein [Stakelama marina]